MKHLRLSAAPFLFLLSACLEGSTGPPGTEVPVIETRVSGGIAGVDYTLRVDGPRREVVGLECISGCDFQEGEILHGLTRDQAAYLASLFRDAGVHQLDGTDFGTQCCDQFFYHVTYLDSEGESSFGGSSELLPQDLREAVSIVAAYARDVVPVVVDMDTRPELWRRDAAVLTGWGVSGNLAELQVGYSGGCRAHYFDLVIFGGWRESQPVQVSAFLSHDANGDRCEAHLTENLIIDLRPLKEAYERVYGVSEPGSTTLMVTLEGIPSFSSFSPLPLEYVF